MVQKLEIYPEEIFKPGKITFNDIDMCQYNKTIEEEKSNFSTEDFVRIYRDMSLIREFENCIDHLKKEGSYRGIEYNHAGPAHLSMGQESAAVGQAYILGVDDHIFGSHRSHSEIMAKGLSAIQKLDDAKLLEVMEGLWEGATLRVVEKGHTGSVKELAVKFLVYGAYAEMFAVRPDLTVALVVLCTLSLLPLGFIRIMLLWVAPGRLLRGRLSSSA